MFMALVLGLTPWGMGHAVQWLHPALPSAEAWRIVGTTIMCMWTPCCLLAGAFASRWLRKTP